MRPINDRSWISRLLSMGVRHDHMSSAMNRSGSLQQEAYIRQLLKETRQMRLDHETALKDITFIILDTETTGFQVNEDEIFSLSATKTKGGKGTASYSTLIKPERPIPASISALTGIQQSDVDHAPPINKVLPTILNFLSNGILVGYHITHDLTFLNAHLKNTAQQKLPHPSFELRQLMERTFQKPFPTLDHALSYLEIPCEQRHTAEGDVKAMVQVWEKLYVQFESRQLITLYDLYAFIGSY